MFGKSANFRERWRTWIIASPSSAGRWFESTRRLQNMQMSDFACLHQHLCDAKQIWT
jgi:hypothetical protein